MSIIAAALISVGSGSVALAAERETMPQGAIVCRTIEPVIEHARLVRQPTSTGLREFVEAQIGAGACRQIRSEVQVGVIDIDKRGFALVEDGPNGQAWTDAENLWGYFNTAEKVKAWKRP